DAFVSKLNPTGNALVYSTYLGGTDYDEGFGVAVDGDGNAYITGSTDSTDFPTTSDAYQTSHAGGYEDAFVAKFRTVDRANVIVSKTGNGPLNVGDTGIFTVSLHNNGPNAAHNVAVTDIDVPTGWIVTPSMGSWNPITSTWSVGTLNNGDSATLTISGLVATAMAGTTLTNTVTETQDEQSQETQTATASITVNPLANVIVSKTGNGPLNVGDTGIFTVSLHNDGPNAAHNVAVTDIDVPTGWIVTPSVGSWNPITSTWSVGTLNNGDSATLSISGLITTTMAGTTLTNTVTETQDELNQESQSASASIVVNSVADLYINSWSSKNNPLLGEIFTITFKLGNRGPNTAENVVFTLPLPSGVEFVGVEVDQGTARYDPATRTITWSLGDVVVGDPYAWVRVRALDVGSFIFRPTLTTDTYDPNIESNIQTVTVNVQAAGEPSETVHAQTVGMQKTGAPFIGIVLAILMILGGLITPKKH
ncbi:SBBP repeat-containing protein, partial [Methanobacterium sp. MZD130B]|uniref:SBBP repeat-containing protein n=1 Tax=Methanobacterium sp. MZD130B TaxID=3394378 RepID=UPI0039FCB260